MREIKFRAWNKKKKRWEKVHAIVYIGNEIHQIITYSPSGFILTYTDDRVANIVLMQYTGLKDKNGKEIYEGDIIKFKNDLGQERISVVKYDPAWAAFYVEDEELKYTFDFIEVIEVIGNIYENPELLKEG